jgi:hypothetical protein
VLLKHAPIAVTGQQQRPISYWCYCCRMLLLRMSSPKLVDLTSLDGDDLDQYDIIDAFTMVIDELKYRDEMAAGGRDVLELEWMRELVRGVFRFCE